MMSQEVFDEVIEALKDMPDEEFMNFKAECESTGRAKIIIKNPKANLNETDDK